MPWSPSSTLLLRECLHTCLQSSSVQPFTRSLSTALSLRYPLHTAGDPFSRPSHALALTAVVNGLSIVPPNERHPVCPLEGIQGEDIRREIGERVSTTVAVIKAVLPLLRTAASRPGQSEGVLLSLCEFLCRLSDRQSRHSFVCLFQFPPLLQIFPCPSSRCAQLRMLPSSLCCTRFVVSSPLHAHRMSV